MVVTSAAMEWLILVPTIADEKFQTRAPLHYGEATALKLASVINVADCLDVTDVADAAAVAGAAEADSENLAIHLAADAAETGAASATQPVAEHAAAVVGAGLGGFHKGCSLFGKHRARHRGLLGKLKGCLLYTSPSPRDRG